uniref:Glutathione transferase n=1 Tax=Alexandrium catenella TaxID=2925 RepID=A0A7S1VYR7_ALECA
MSGVRITFVPGRPGMIPLALKNLLDVKGVPYTLVVHPAMGEGDDQALLYELTAQKSVPVMFCDDERPRSAWVEQVVLADKLGKGPSLIPTDPQMRAAMFGMMSELLCEDGLFWNKRLLHGESAFTKKYGWSEGVLEGLPKKLVASLSFFADQLRKQKEQGSRYLLGGSLTAADVYVATLVCMFAPPGPEVLPRTKQGARLIEFFAANPPEVQAFLDGEPGLAEYRDYILQTHCVVPFVLGGDPL